MKQGQATTAEHLVDFLQDDIGVTQQHGLLNRPNLRLK